MEAIAEDKVGLFSLIEAVSTRMVEYIIDSCIEVSSIVLSEFDRLAVSDSCRAILKALQELVPDTTNVEVQCSNVEILATHANKDANDYAANDDAKRYANDANPHGRKYNPSEVLGFGRASPAGQLKFFFSLRGVGRRGVYYLGKDYGSMIYDKIKLVVNSESIVEILDFREVASYIEQITDIKVCRSKSGEEYVFGQTEGLSVKGYRNRLEMIVNVPKYIHGKDSYKYSIPMKQGENEMTEFIDDNLMALFYIPRVLFEKAKIRELEVGINIPLKQCTSKALIDKVVGVKKLDFYMKRPNSVYYSSRQRAKSKKQPEKMFTLYDKRKELEDECGVIFNGELLRAELRLKGGCLRRVAKSLGDLEDLATEQTLLTMLLNKIISIEFYREACNFDYLSSEEIDKDNKLVKYIAYQYMGGTEKVKEIHREACRNGSIDKKTKENRISRVNAATKHYKTKYSRLIQDSIGAEQRELYKFIDFLCIRKFAPPLFRAAYLNSER